MDNRETWLAETLVELADTSASEFVDTEYLRTLASRLRILLAPAEIGLIIGAERGRPRLAAATSDRTRDLVTFELQHDDGPCVRAYRNGETVLNQDVSGAEQPWPRFAEKARAVGVRFASALPMRRHADIVGAVGILDARGSTVSAQDIALARTLAEAATIGLRQQRALEVSTQRSTQLQHALDSRIVIEQAKGMVAARLGLSLGEAFGLLRDHSRQHNERLAEVAAKVIRQELFMPEDTRRPDLPPSPTNRTPPTDRTPAN